MAIQTLHDTGSSYPITSKMDGGVYQVSSQDCVIGGIGDEFTIQYANNSLNVSFDAGSEAVICGAFFTTTSLEAVTLTANTTIYLCANIDLSKPNGSRGSFVERTAYNMQSDNLNGSGSSRDLLLYIVTTGATGVTNVVDKRKIVYESNSEITEDTDFNISGTEFNLTKVSGAVKLSNSVLLDSGSVKIGVDITNVLATNQYDYTATQDCWMDLAGGTNTGTKQGYSIDGICVSGLHEYLAGNLGIFLTFIKKGQRVRIVTNSSDGSSAVSGYSRMTFYGTK